MRRKAPRLGALLASVVALLAISPALASACPQVDLALGKTQASAGETVPYSVAGLEPGGTYTITVRGHTVVSGGTSPSGSFTMPDLGPNQMTVQAELVATHAESSPTHPESGGGPYTSSRSMTYLAPAPPPEEPAPPPEEPAPPPEEPAPPPEQREPKPEKTVIEATGPESLSKTGTVATTSSALATVGGPAIGPNGGGSSPHLRTDSGGPPPTGTSGAEASIPTEAGVATRSGIPTASSVLLASLALALAVGALGVLALIARRLTPDPEPAAAELAAELDETEVELQEILAEERARLLLEPAHSRAPPDRDEASAADRLSGVA